MLDRVAFTLCAAMLTHAACARDIAPTPPAPDIRPVEVAKSPPPPAPAVRPVEPEPPADNTRLAATFEGVVQTPPVGCVLFFAGNSSGSRIERTIPLGKVTWKIGEREHWPIAIATCETKRDKCITGRSESHTTGIPHSFHWEHDEHSHHSLAFVRGTRDAAKLIDELNAASMRCARKQP
jgi:hypothetical protein